MTYTRFRRINERDRSSVIAALTSAFFEDPLLRWMYPDDERYFHYFERFVYAYGGDPFQDGCGMTYEDGQGAVVLWHPSGDQCTYEDLHACFRETVPESRQEDVIAVFDEFERLHPREPYRFFTFFARDFRSSRSALPLLRAFFQCSDEDGLCVVGDTTSAVHARYYSKAGAEVLGVVQRGTSPSYYPMMRKCRAQL